MRNPNAASIILQTRKHEIIESFEVESRRRILSAADKDSHTVRDELPHLIDSLVMKLVEGVEKVAPDEAILSQNHGQQRAGLTHYQLVEVIEEYGILREVIMSELSGVTVVSAIDLFIINRTIDNAIKLASGEFARAEKSKLKLALASAESSNHALEQFAAVAAHDLRAPLASIGGFAELLRHDLQKDSDFERLSHLEYISNAVKRMSELIDGILAYAKLGRTEKPLTPISMEDAVMAATQNLKAQLTESSGRVAHEPLPTILGSLPLLSQLFQNLFSNAIKFRSPRPPVIDVTVNQSDDCWTFCVSDNGIGFEMKYAQEIFKANKQLGPLADMGNGLGLATCLRVVEIHGGRMWATSVPDKGSKFFFTIPVACVLKEDV